MAEREYPLSLIIKAVDRATGPLREINAKIQKFTEPVRRLNNSFRALSAEAGFPKLAKAVGHLGSEIWDLGKKVGLLGIGAAVGLYSVVHSAMEAGDQLGKMAERVGLSVDAYAQLRFAAAQADVEQEEFNGAMDQFNKRLGEAKAGGGPLLAFLEKVAPKLALQVKNAKSTEEALGLMTGAFEKVEDPGKRAALSAAAFGKSGLQMGVWLHQGSKAIGEQRKRYAELAGSQQEFADGADVLDQAARETEVAFLGLRNAAATALFPALTELAKALSGLLSGNRDKIAAWARDLGTSLTGWVKGGGLERLTAQLGNLKIAFIGLGVVLGANLLTSIGGVASALWSLGAAAVPMAIRGLVLLAPVLWKAVVAMTAFNLTNPIGWIMILGTALAGAAYLIYKHWGPIKEFFVDLWEKIKGIINAVAGIFGWKPFDIGTSGGGGQASAMSGAAGPVLGASHVVAGTGLQTQSAHVSVDFANMPKGTRVTADPNGTADVDLSLGYSMAASH